MFGLVLILKVCVNMRIISNNDCIILLRLIGIQQCFKEEKLILVGNLSILKCRILTTLECLCVQSEF